MATANKETKNEVAKTASSAVPAHLQGGKTTKIGNVDSTDLIIPRIKLLQATSPEVMDDIDGAKIGYFWHTIAAQNLGNKLLGIPIIIKKSYVLWSPRGDDRGILARAEDGLNWDNAGMSFTVKPEKSPHEITYKLGKTVHERTGDGPALSEFGSSIPGDTKSPPAASLTYQMLWYFPQFQEFSPSIIINTRSSVQPAKGLLSKIDLRPVDHFGQVYEIGVAKQGEGKDVFFNYTYTAAGYADAADFEITKALFERFSKETWKANDEATDTDTANVGGGGPKGPIPEGVKF